MTHHKYKLQFSDGKLKKFYNGNPSYVANKLHKPVHDILSMLAHGDIESLRKNNRYRFHKLSFNRKGFYAVKIDKNHRIIFRLEGPNVRDITLVDYH